MTPDEKPPQDKIDKIISNDNLSDEQFEDKLAEELRKKQREKELEENMINALKNCI